jgi:thymidylate synthase
MLKRVLEQSSKKIDNVVHDEHQYLNLIKDILTYGNTIQGRNGAVKTVIGSSMHFSLKDGIMPILTTKKVAWKTCLKELFWFIKGDTNNQHLQDQKVGIWNENASREFLDEQGLFHYKENDLGPIYGHQWRHFNATYTTCDEDYSGKGVDQLDYILQQLKNPEKRSSRRLIMSAWNPCQLNEMALPPCHILVHFNVTGANNDELSCNLYQRSGDVGLGVPFNIASYSFLTHLIAEHCGLKATDFYYHLGNCHIYAEHLEVLKEQSERVPLPFPTIAFKNNNNIKNSIEDYTMDDIDIMNYQSYEKVVMQMKK